MSIQSSFVDGHASLQFLIRYIFYVALYLVFAVMLVTQLPSDRAILSASALPSASEAVSFSPANLPAQSSYEGLWVGAWGGEAAAFFEKNIDMKLAVTKVSAETYRVAMTLLGNEQYGIPPSHFEREVILLEGEPLSWVIEAQQYSFRFDESTGMLLGHYRVKEKVNEVALYRAGGRAYRAQSEFPLGPWRIGFYDDPFADALFFSVWLDGLIESALYLLVAVPPFWFLNRGRKRGFLKRQIQGPPRAKQWVHELGYSLTSVLIFSLVGTYLTYLAYAGVLELYPNIADRGVLYWLFSLVLGLILHDTYFYWAHRLMHVGVFYKTFHHAHHLSKAPTTLASYAFGPVEALVQAAFIPLVAWLVPMHFSVVVLLFVANLVRSAVGHSGFEVFPRNTLTSPWLKWNATVTHHDMHHEYGQGNYALYFSWWDKWMGTEHANYARSFYAVRDKIEKKQR